MKKIAFVALTAFQLAWVSNAEQVKFSDLPSSVQKTINRNLNGGTVQEVELKSHDGISVYDVDIRRDGKNRNLLVDTRGKLLARNTGTIVGDNQGVTSEPSLKEDIFDKNDGEILNVVPAPKKDVDVQAEVDLDTDDHRNLEVQAGTDVDSEKGIFRKGDGKILGIPIPGRKKSDSEISVNVETDQNKITTDADGGLDTDKEDGRILGVPKRGFETLSLNDLPPVVREAIRREAGGYKIAEIERATVDGRMVYEVDIEREGANRELHIASNGNILKDSDRDAVGRPASTERGQSEQPRNP